MELGWIAVRPVRNRLLLGSFIILPLRLGISKYKYLVFQFIFTGFVHYFAPQITNYKIPCVSVHSESNDGSGLYIVPCNTEAPLILERLAREGQRKEEERLAEEII